MRSGTVIGATNRRSRTLSREAGTGAELPMPTRITTSARDDLISPSSGKVVAPAEREMILARWGLVPFFTKNPVRRQRAFDDQC